MIEVKFDAITVTGNSEYTLEGMSNMLGDRWDLEYGTLVFKRSILEEKEIDIARIYANKHQKNSYRVDFNPNKIVDNEGDMLTNIIKNFRNAHFTRIDIAFDVLNNPLMMKHKVYRSNVSTERISIENLTKDSEITGRSGNLESMYWGKRKSEQLIRLYDKKAEQKAHRKRVPTDIEEWGRLELQLRGSKTAEWLNCTYQMLDEFKLPNLMELDLKDRVDLYAIDSGIASWKDYAKEKRARLRKLVKQSQGFDTTLADEMKKVLNENLTGMNEYLTSLGVKTT